MKEVSDRLFDSLVPPLLHLLAHQGVQVNVLGWEAKADTKSECNKPEFSRITRGKGNSPAPLSPPFQNPQKLYGKRRKDKETVRETCVIQSDTIVYVYGRD